MSKLNEFFRKINQAFSESNIDFILQQVTDDITWELVGDFVIEGKQDFEKEMQKMQHVKTLDMQTEHTITHGRTAAVNGKMKILDQGKEKSFGFCDLYELNGFKNAKIMKMTSYVIALE